MEHEHHHHAYSDMPQHWSSDSITDFERLVIIFQLLVDISAIALAVAIIIHMILTLRYPDYRRHSPDMMYMRIGEYLYTGEFEAIVSISLGFSPINC